MNEMSSKNASLSPSLLEFSLLNLYVFASHSRHSLGNLVDYFPAGEPSEFKQGRLAPAQQSVDNIGKALVGTLFRLKLAIRRILKRDSLTAHASMYVYLCIYLYVPNRDECATLTGSTKISHLKTGIFGL